MTQLDPISARPWTRKTPPKRVLAIRLQAMGDTMLSLPYLLQLRKDLPSSTRLDFLTREETEGIPKNIELFDKVYTIGGARSYKRQLIHTLLLLPALLIRRYDLILDLQNNSLSRLVRKTLRPHAWVEYDRFSPIPAATRYKRTIEAAGIGASYGNARFLLKDPAAGIGLLTSRGWQVGNPLIVLNPAGAFETRHWPLDNYITFANRWSRHVPGSKFLILGTGFIGAKARGLQAALGESLIDLTGLTTTEEAFAILQRATLMISEDSGLMHMAWCSGIPTIALFGSTRSDWSRPLGPHTVFLDSSDLPCGNCMKAVCIHGDNRCMTRHDACSIFMKAAKLVELTASNSDRRWD